MAAEVIIYDWQDLKLPKIVPPGKYMVNVNVYITKKKTVENYNLSFKDPWYPVTEVNIIPNKRQILDDIIRGKSNDLLLGLKVVLLILSG
jgi:hypothetical protein